MTDQETDVLLQALTEGLNKSAEMTFRLGAPIKVPCIKNNAYKTRPLVGDEEFLLEKIRMGARKQVIFVMKPMDARDYEAAEFDEKIVFKAFPELEETVCTWLEGSQTTFWLKEKTAFVRRKLNEIQAAKDADESGKYAENPMWGSF